MNTLRLLLHDYLTTRRGLGFKLISEGTGLATFVSYMESTGFDHITNEIALKWAQLPTAVQDISGLDVLVSYAASPAIAVRSMRGHRFHRPI